MAKASSLETVVDKRAGVRLLRISKIARWENGLGLRIPKEAAERLKLQDGARVSVEVYADSIVIRPIRRIWSEAELLAGVTPEMVGGEVDWGAAVGREIS